MPMKMFTSSQNVAMLHFLVKEVGEGFKIKVNFLPNPQRMYSTLTSMSVYYSFFAFSSCRLPGNRHFENATFWISSIFINEKSVRPSDGSLNTKYILSFHWIRSYYKFNLKRLWAIQKILHATWRMGTSCKWIVSNSTMFWKPHNCVIWK